METTPGTDEQQRLDGAGEVSLRGTIYAAVTQGYDREPLGFPKEEGVERELRMHPCRNTPEGVLWNREQKIMLPPTNGLWSLYLDGSLRPKGPIAELVEEWLSVKDMALFKHPHRSCAYDEIDACVVRKKISAKQAEKTRGFLMLHGFPKDFGLWACGMIARRSHANATQSFCAPMWWQFVAELPRDQIWLPFVLWKIRNSTNRIHTIDADIFNNDHFSFRRHGT